MNAFLISSMTQAPSIMHQDHIPVIDPATQSLKPSSQIVYTRDHIFSPLLTAMGKKEMGLHGFYELNLGPYASIASTLQTEAFP